MRKQLLIDACVAAAYFAPSTTHSGRLRRRSKTLFEGLSTSYETSLLIPNFCIAEVFSVFEKYRWGGSWNSHVKRATRLTPRAFDKAKSGFHNSIHNGSRLLQIELNRYHILCIDLVAAINHAYQIKRRRKIKKKNITPAKTYDLLILAMGIWLQKQFGRDNFAIVTGDERIELISRRAASTARSQDMKRHLATMAGKVGLTYHPDIYPHVIDLGHDSPSEINALLPSWNFDW